MGDKMTLVEVRDAIRDQCQCCPPDDSLYEEWADAIDVHLATPVQTVDVEAVREVISCLSSSAFADSFTKDQADKLSQAIGDKT